MLVSMSSWLPGGLSRSLYCDVDAAGYPESWNRWQGRRCGYVDKGASLLIPAMVLVYHSTTTSPSELDVR